MKRLALCSALTAMLCCSLPLGVHAQQGFFGKPERLQSLSDLATVDTGELSDPQKTEVLLSWLAEERKAPSPTITGLGGGPIDTDYVQAQIVKTMVTKSDPLAVEWLASAKTLKDEGTRNGMRLILGALGEKKQVPVLEHILLSNPNPYFRAMAADDLEQLGSVSSVSVLERALNDKFFLTFASEAHEGRIVTTFPVREAAQQTLRTLQSPALLAYEVERGKFLARRLSDAKAKQAASPAKTSPTAMEHLVHIANGEETAD